MSIYCVKLSSENFRMLQSVNIIYRYTKKFAMAYTQHIAQ